MNVSQLASYYVNLGAYSVSALSSSSSTGSSASYAVTESTEDTVSISETSRALNNLASTLTEVRGLAELAAREGISSDLRTEITSRANNLLKSIDEQVKNDDGSSLTQTIDLSSVDGSQKAIASIDEGLTAIDSKRQEMGITTASRTTSAPATYSASSRINSMSDDEVASLINSLTSRASGSSSQISILLSSINGNNNTALNGLYSLL